MEFIMELIFDLILEGSVELLPNRRVPLILRILAGLILGAAYGGLIILGAYLAIKGYQSQDWPLTAVGLGLAVLILVCGIALWSKYKKQNSDL